jgi:hypothetical protein
MIGTPPLHDGEGAGGEVVSGEVYFSGFYCSGIIVIFDRTLKIYANS